MSEDKSKLTPKQKDEIQVAFEEFGEHKYKDWKVKREKAQDKFDETTKTPTPGVDNRSEEQKAFETYIADQDIYKAPKFYIWRDLDDFNECVTKGPGCYRVGTQTYGKPKAVGGGKSPVNAGETGVVEVMFENTENSGREQVIQRFTSVASCRTFVRKYAKYGGDRDWSEWKEYSLGGSTPTPTGLKPIKMVEVHFADKFDTLKGKATSNGQKIYVEQNVKIDVGDLVIINVKEGKVNDVTGMSMIIFGEVKATGLAGEITIDGKGYSTGIKTYSQSEIDDKIARAGGGQGGGSMNYIKLPTGDRSTSYTKTVDGDFACNLIDYRLLSAKSTKLGTVGSHIKVINDADKIYQTKPLPHTIKNKYKSGLEQYTKNTYGGPIGISGIKKDKEMIVNTTWYQLPKTPDEAHRRGAVKLSFLLDDYTQNPATVTQEDMEFVSTTPVQSSKKTLNKVGRYCLDLGSKGDGEFFAVNFHAFYCKNTSNPLIPYTLDRRFVFGNYKGHELKATYSIKDEYKEHALGNVLVRNVGRIKLRDLTWYSATDYNPNAQHFIFAKVPDDCKVPTSDSDEANKKKLGGQLLTNNLSEVPPENPLSPPYVHLEGLKYDRNPPYLEQIIEKVPRIGITEWCFVLVSNPDNAKHWKDLLSETELLYELKEPEVIYLKEGGYRVQLSDGSELYSHDFFEVKDVPAEDCYFFRYSTNGQGVRIPKSQIVSVSPVD